MTAAAAAVSMVSVRNWHSTQSCAHVAVWVRCPWQLWCVQSIQSFSAWETASSCTWSDEKTSIGRNTANSNHDARCRFVVKFTAAKVIRFFWIAKTNGIFLRLCFLPTFFLFKPICDNSRSLFGVLSQIAPRVATIRRKFGENLWNLPEIVISLQCRSDKQHLSDDMFNNLKL